MTNATLQTLAPLANMLSAAPTGAERTRVTDVMLGVVASLSDADLVATTREAFRTAQVTGDATDDSVAGALIHLVGARGILNRQTRA
jgi:hypothetical protein